MKITSKSISACAVITSSLFLSTPTALAITINLSVSSNNNTPESAVANALRDSNSTGVCDTLSTIEIPTSNQVHMQTFCAALNSVTELETGPAYTALSARSISSITSFTANNFISSLNIGDIAKRLASLRKSATGINKKSAALFKSRPPLASLYTGEPLTGGGASADEIADEAGGLNDNRLSGYINASVTGAEQDETLRLSGYDSETSSLLLGIDYRFSNNIFAGVAVKTLNGDIDLIENRGAVHVTNNALSFYGSYYPSENIYVQSTLTAGQGSYDITRRIDFTLNGTAFSEVAKSSPDGKGYSFSVSSGYDHYFTGTGISSVTDISLGYAQTDIDGFIEKNAQGFNLIVAKQSIESLTSKVGIQISKSVSTSFGVLLPEFSAAWKHEFKADGEDIIAAFAIDPSTAFSYTTDQRDSDYFVFALATSMVLPHGFMGYLQYEKVFDIDNYDASTLNIGARLEF